MRIGLYGLPTAGKTYILNMIRKLEVLSGSKMLLDICPDFYNSSEKIRKQARESLAKRLASMDNFIMDGHYSFGDNIVFTDHDGELYDVFMYLYVNPDILKKRMENSERNKKYLQYNLEKWQRFELESLREYCHLHDKDFYIIDNPEEGFFSDVSQVLQFIDSLVAGFSCVQFAKTITDDILIKCQKESVYLSDGDKTLINEDSSGMVGYTTHVFDGNFYTGFQSWRHHNELSAYLSNIGSTCPMLVDMDIHYNDIVKKNVNDGFILTTGYLGIWKQISDEIGVPIYYGNQMSAETKYYVVKFLQLSGRKVYAYGDSMNDYYMLKQSDEGYLITKKNGDISRSLQGKDLGGIQIV